MRPLRLPNLGRLGLGNLKHWQAFRPHRNIGRPLDAARSPRPEKILQPGTGKWPASIWRKPFPLFPNGFPPEVMHAFEERIGRTAIGNCAASGTEIIQELGEEHMRTGSPIVYTSADSVFQVAAHEDVIPLWELYQHLRSGARSSARAV